MAQIGHERREAANLKIATENDPHPLGLFFVDPDLAVLNIVAERHHPADQSPLRLEAEILSRMRSEVTSRSNWANESRILSVAHGGGGIELLGDGYERNLMLVEQLDKLGKVC